MLPRQGPHRPPGGDAAIGRVTRSGSPTRPHLPHHRPPSWPRSGRRGSRSIAGSLAALTRGDPPGRISPAAASPQYVSIRRRAYCLQSVSGRLCLELAQAVSGVAPASQLHQDAMLLVEFDAQADRRNTKGVILHHALVTKGKPGRRHEGPSVERCMGRSRPVASWHCYFESSQRRAWSVSP